jgi:hypothetical protein
MHEKYEKMQIKKKTDWWFGTFFSIQLGMSSSQLTNSIIFQKGRYTTNQFVIFMVNNGERWLLING